MTNEYFKESIASSKGNFVNFVKINTPDLTEENLKEIDFLAHKIAKNLFHF